MELTACVVAVRNVRCERNFNWKSKFLGLGGVAISMFFFFSQSSHAEEKKSTTTTATGANFSIPPSNFVHRFVITGGPCAGKSTAIMEVADRLRSLGFQVYVVPELSTIFHHAGVHFPASFGSHVTRTWEASRILAQMALEDSFLRVAQATGKETILLCDRGVMDTKAYMREDEWEAMLDQQQWNVVGMRDRRYDAVVHMITAAIGAEKFYTKANNEARRESLQEAIDLDIKTREAWLGHSQLRIIDNRTDFSTKVRRVSEFFCSLLDAPAPHGKRRYFIVSFKEIADQSQYKNGLPIKAQECYLTSTFLKQRSDGNDIVLRRRGQDGHYTYDMAFKNATDGKTWIKGRTINSKQYMSLLEHADPHLKAVHRRRLCFQWGKQYYELDQPTNQSPGGESVLIVDSEPEKQIEIPPFLHIEREVTDEYSLLRLAKGSFPTSHPVPEKTD